MKKYAFFPGCTISTRFPHFESTTMKVLKKLDVELKHIKDWTCCPEPLSIHMVNSESWYAIAARNICLAEEMGLNILTVCSGCNSTLFRVNEELKKNEKLRTKVNNHLQKIGKQFRGTIEIKSILRVLYRDIGEEEIKRHVTKPLHNIKVAVHYGCHIFDELKHFEENPQDPQSVQKLVKALGGEVVDYPSKMLCCSGFARNINEEITFMNIEEKLIDLTTVKADCLVLMCPNCFLQYDLGQVSIRQKFKRNYKVPIIYLTQLLGLAIGFNSQEMGLNFHRSPTDSLIKKIEGIPVLVS